MAKSELRCTRVDICYGAHVYVHDNLFECSGFRFMDDWGKLCLINCLEV